MNSFIRNLRLYCVFVGNGFQNLMYVHTLQKISLYYITFCCSRKVLSETSIYCILSSHNTRHTHTHKHEHTRVCAETNRKSYQSLNKISRYVAIIQWFEKTPIQSVLHQIFTNDYFLLAVYCYQNSSILSVPAALIWNWPRVLAICIPISLVTWKFDKKNWSNFYLQLL